MEDLEEIEIIGELIENINFIRHETIEWFEGDILVESEDSNGNIYLEKWCDLYNRDSRDNRIDRFLVAKTDKDSIKKYKNLEISMLDLIKKFGNDVWLHDLSRNGSKMYKTKLEDLPDSYLPDKDCMHDFNY